MNAYDCIAACVVSILAASVLLTGTVRKRRGLTCFCGHAKREHYSGQSGCSRVCPCLFYEEDPDSRPIDGDGK